MPLTYHSYLKIEELLSLQKLQSPDEHDELLFIVIHQAYELWFRQMLHELDFVGIKLDEGNVESARPKLKRSLTILKVLVHQVDILETMTPLEFLSFRDYLETASGFQSYQWRELEYALGLRNPRHIDRFPPESDIRKGMEQRLADFSLWQRFLRFLAGIGYDIPKEEFEIPAIGEPVANPAVQSVLTNLYYHRPDLSSFCELWVDLDEGIQEWRYRHTKMVERTIGSKMGTGGSLGVEYLKNSLFKPLFPDLWEIRSSFVRS